jgi:plastocyanin
MKQRILLRSGLAGLVLVVVLLTPLIALAGGFTVALDKPPGDVEAGKLLTIGFLIRSAHTDRRPQPGLQPLIKASSLATDEQVTAIAQPEGDAGHYVANLTFPSAGEWHWQIYPFAKEDTYTLDLPGPLEVHAAGAKVAPVAAGIPRDVRALDSTFDTQTLTIPAGTTVAWRNTSKLPHTVKATNDMFASGNLEPGASYLFTFAKPGTYAYYCEYHGSANGQGMVGTITVLAAAQPAAISAVQPGSAAQPQATLPVTGATEVLPGRIILIVALIVVVLGLTLRWRRGPAASE